MDGRQIFISQAASLQPVFTSHFSLGTVGLPRWCLIIIILSPAGGYGVIFVVTALPRFSPSSKQTLRCDYFLERDAVNVKGKCPLSRPGTSAGIVFIKRPAVVFTSSLRDLQGGEGTAGTQFLESLFNRQVKSSED